MLVLRRRKVDSEVRVRERRAGVRKSLRGVRGEGVVEGWGERGGRVRLGGGCFCGRGGGAGLVVGGECEGPRYQIMDVA